MFLRSLFISLLWLAGANLLLSQDAAAVDALTRANQALTGGTAVNALILHGNVSYVAGSTQDYGPVLFAAAANLGSKVLLHLSAGDSTEIAQTQQNVWIDASGASHPTALHNRQASSFWFAPALLVNHWLTATNLVLSSLGSEQVDGGASVVHLHCVRSFLTDTDAATSAFMGKAGAMDLYLDATTYLPVSLTFNLHPDNNELIDLPVNIKFSDYRAQSGGQAPFRIQRYWQGSLFWDVTITSIDVNPAVSTADFPLPR